MPQVPSRGPLVPPHPCHQILHGFVMVPCTLVSSAPDASGTLPHGPLFLASSPPDASGTLPHGPLFLASSPPDASGTFLSLSPWHLGTSRIVREGGQRGEMQCV